MSVLSDAVLIADDAGRLTYVSPNAHFIFGYSPSDILKQGRVSFLLPGDLFDRDVLEQRGEIANIECQIRDAVGRARNLLVTVRRVDRQGGTVLFACRDVTERKRIQLDYDLLSLTLERRVEERTQELRESRERYRRLVEGLRDEYLFYATDAQGTVVYVSPSIHNILGRTPDQAIGHNWREFVDTEHPTYPELEKLERMRFAGTSDTGIHRRRAARGRPDEDHGIHGRARARRRRARDHERGDRARHHAACAAGGSLAASARAT